MPTASETPVADAPLIFTIGHSTHPIERFLELLGQHRIATLADVRSFPSSRKWPQFNQAPLAESLERAGIAYRWMKPLGGRRHGNRADSPHGAWQHPAFRSYADYTDSAEFAAGLAELIELAAQARTAYMCSEGLWWRCHRRIISDHMVVRGWRVEHIMPTGKLSAHVLASFARVTGGRIIYDGSTIQGSDGTTGLKPAR
ncbi:MAG: DUF488 domain-containing protein [Candidatus Binataceae bacterium]